MIKCTCGKQFSNLEEFRYHKYFSDSYYQKHSVDVEDKDTMSLLKKTKKKIDRKINKFIGDNS
jgi:hypothetical protein